MQLTVADVMTNRGQILPLSRDLREAVARYAKMAWPAKTSGHVAHAWGLDHETARNLLKGHASDATLTKVFRNGGWQVASAVLGAVIGETYEAFIEKELEEIADERRRLEDIERAARNKWSRVLAHRAADGGELRLVAQEDRHSDRDHGPSAGKLGSRASGKP